MACAYRYGLDVDQSETSPRHIFYLISLQYGTALL